MFDTTNILHVAKVSQYVKELPRFISYGQLGTFSLDTTSWSSRNELLWLVPKNTLSNIDKILFNIPDNYEEMLSERLRTELHIALENGDVDLVNIILRRNIHLTVDKENGLIVSPRSTSTMSRELLLEDPVEISSPLTIPQALELAKDLNDEYFYGMLCFDIKNNTVVNPLHPMVALELTQNNLLENHSEKLYKTVYYRLKQNFKELPNVASLQSGPQKFNGNISKIFDVISSACINKIEGTATLNTDNYSNTVEKHVNQLNRNYQAEVLKSIPMLDILTRESISFSEFSTACKSYQNENLSPEDYMDLSGMQILNRFREKLDVNGVAQALKGENKESSTIACITNSELPLSNLYAVIPQQAIVNRIAYPYYGISLFENSTTKAVETDTNQSSKSAIGKCITPMLSSNISLDFQSYDGTNDSRLDNFSKHSCTTVSLATLNKWTNICTGSQPQNTIDGLRVMNMSNAGSPLNRYILLNGWYEWTKACINESLEIYKGNTWIK